MSHDRFELLNPDLGNLSIVEHVQAGQQILLQRTVTPMPQLHERDGSMDNLMLSRSEIVMCGSRYQLDLVEELAISQLNIAFRIARRVVKFLDLVLLAVPRVHRISGDGVYAPRRFQHQRLDSLHLYGLEAYTRAVRGGDKTIQRAQKSLCLVEDERRHGKPVPITA